MSVFDPKFADLPEVIPIFPLPGALLLPGGRLPLNIFEPRYLAMVEGALRGDRMIGMIQPTDASDMAGRPPLYRTGCAGRIRRFEESSDGRFLITLSGLCRFDIAEELDLYDGFRRVRADWSPYAGDMEPPGEAELDRERLFPALRTYFAAEGIDAEWETVGAAPDERLVTCLSMICPFGVSEKQALLEAPDLAARAEILTTLVEMGAAGEGKAGCARVR